MAFDSDGYWDQLSLSLEGGVDQAAVVEGTSTHFGCDQQTGFRLTLYDTDSAFADCKEWGAENDVFDGNTQQLGRLFLCLFSRARHDP